VASASLDHPFICKVFEVVDSGDASYIVMEYVEGQTLHQRLASGPLPFGECLRIAGEWPPDVLICDIGLPDDDGYGLLRRLRHLPAGERVPAIALTAYTRPEDRAKALAAGFRAHLAKPLDPDNLLREISLAISKAPPAA